MSITEAIAKWLVEQKFVTPHGDHDMYVALDLEKYLEKLGFNISPKTVAKS